jgi:putative transposase
LNRGNARASVFRKPRDYEAFSALLGEAGLRVSMRLIAYCLMPNHFHLAVWPLEDGDLSRWIQWLLTTHVRRYLAHYHRTGHVW